MSDHRDHRQPERIEIRVVMPERVDVHVHLPGLAEVAALILKAFNELKQEIQKMSGTLAEQLAAAQAETNAALDGIATDVGEIAADVDQLLAGVQPGTTLTLDMVNAMTSIRDRAVAAKGGLDAVNAKVPPAPPAP